MITALLALIAFAHGEAPAPRLTTACAALLTDPTVARLSVGRSAAAVAEATRTIAAAEVVPKSADRAHDSFEMMHGLLARLGVRTKVVEFTREVTGRREIAEVVSATRQAAFALEAEIDRSDRAPARFWTVPRVLGGVRTAVIPVTLAALWLEQLSIYGQHPELFPYLAVPVALVDGAALVMTRKFWVRTARLIRALWHEPTRLGVQSADADRASQVLAFGDFVTSPAAERPPRHFDSAYFYAMLTPRLHALLIDAPRADADPREIENYRALLIDALSDTLAAKADDVRGLARVDLKYFVDEDEVPHLVLGVKMMMESIGRRPARRAADGGSESIWAAGPAWAPAPAPVRVPVRVQ